MHTRFQIPIFVSLEMQKSTSIFLFFSLRHKLTWQHQELAKNVIDLLKVHYKVMKKTITHFLLQRNTQIVKVCTIFLNVLCNVTHFFFHLGLGQSVALVLVRDEDSGKFECPMCKKSWYTCSGAHSHFARFNGKCSDYGKEKRIQFASSFKLNFLMF